MLYISLLLYVGIFSFILLVAGFLADLITGKPKKDRIAQASIKPKPVMVTQSFMDELSKLSVCGGFGMNQVVVDANMLYKTLSVKILEKREVMLECKE